MRFLRWIAAVLVGVLMISALATFGVTLNTRLTVFDRNTWKETLAQVYDVGRLNTVMQAIGPELAEEMRGDELSELQVIQMELAREAVAVAQVFQPSIERYISNAVDGVWDYLTGESEVIDLGPLSYAEVLESSVTELHSQVRAARDGSEEPASETVAFLSELPADEVDEALMEVTELYRAAFVFMEPLAHDYGEQVYYPTAADEAFRREFHQVVSALHITMAVSAVVVLLCIGAFVLIGTSKGSRLRLVGNTLLWYSIPSALFLSVMTTFTGLVSFMVQQLAASAAAEPQRAEAVANLMRVILAEYREIWLRFFMPLLVFVGITLAAGLLIRILGRRQRPEAPPPRTARA